MLDYTPTEHTEYQNIKRAHTRAKKLNEQIEIIVSQAEAVLRVYNIQEKFDSSAPNLVQPYRRFLRYGNLTEVGEVQPRFVALFNDSLVVASAGNAGSIDRSYHFLRMLPLHKATVKAIPDHPPSKYRIT